MDYIDCKANLIVVKNKSKWENDQVEFWKEEEYGWCARLKGEEWQYGYNTLKDAIIAHTMTLAQVEQSVNITGSMLIDKDYEQTNAWNKNNKDKKVSAINCSVIVRRFTA